MPGFFSIRSPFLPGIGRLPSPSFPGLASGWATVLPRPPSAETFACLSPHLETLQLLPNMAILEPSPE